MDPLKVIDRIRVKCSRDNWSDIFALKHEDVLAVILNGKCHSCGGPISVTRVEDN